MTAKLIPLLCALALGAAACGEQASTGSSAGQDQGGLTPKSGIEPSPGTKGPGKVDSSGGNEARDGAATQNRTFQERLNRGKP